jgi:hypothetical protein
MESRNSLLLLAYSDIFMITKSSNLSLLTVMMLFSHSSVINDFAIEMCGSITNHL